MTGYPVDLSQPVDWDNVPPCPFANPEDIRKLRFRETPHWHALARCRHIGLYRPNAEIATWTARILTSGKRYRQRRIGSALEGQPGALSYEEALAKAVAWFRSNGVQEIANGTSPIGRTTTLNFCPVGDVYTVGHALTDYIAWSRIARSPGSHYNNLVLINYHLSGDLAVRSARGVLCTAPERHRPSRSGDTAASRLQPSSAQGGLIRVVRRGPAAAQEGLQLAGHHPEGRVPARLGQWAHRVGSPLALPEADRRGPAAPARCS